MSASDITVLLAGKRNAGKSVLFKNMLGRNNTDDTDAEIILGTTYEVQHTRKEDKTIQIIDPPNFPELIESLSKEVELKFDLIFLCIPVSSASKFNENSRVMKFLHDYYGKEIWKRCIVVFTFSNEAWDHTHSVEKYKTHIDKFRNEFQAEVKKLEGSIAAIPIICAGLKCSEEFDQKWLDNIFDEILTRCRHDMPPSMPLYQQHKDETIMEYIKTAAIGGTIGACLLGPIGLAAGTAIGAAVGAGAGAGVGALAGTAVTKFRQSKK